MTSRQLLAVGGALLLLTGVIVPATATAQETRTAPAFVVELNTDGSATVTTVFTYDLTSEEEQQAFAELRNDTATREEAKQRYADRLGDVAAAAENATGREMAVSDPSIEVYTTDDGDTGVVALSVVWDGLAAVDDETLTVTEPFASGFTPDRRFLLVPPEGYAVSDASPTPDDTTTALVWEAGTDLSGFTVTLAPDPSSPTTDADGGAPTSTSSSVSAPGFGFGAALAAVILGTFWVARTRSR